MRVDWKVLVDEKIPNFFRLFSRIQRFILRVTDTAELFVRARRFSAITLTDELDNAVGLVDSAPQQLAQVATFCSEDVLPHRFVAEKTESISDELPRALQFLGDGRNEDYRPKRHGKEVKRVEYR